MLVLLFPSITNQTNQTYMWHPGLSPLHCCVLYSISVCVSDYIFVCISVCIPYCISICIFWHFSINFCLFVFLFVLSKQTYRTLRLYWSVTTALRNMKNCPRLQKCLAFFLVMVMVIVLVKVGQKLWNWRRIWVTELFSLSACWSKADQPCKPRATLIM